MAVEDDELEQPRSTSQRLRRNYSQTSLDVMEYLGIGGAQPSRRSGRPADPGPHGPRDAELSGLHSDLADRYTGFGRAAEREDRHYAGASIGGNTSWSPTSMVVARGSSRLDTLRHQRLEHSSAPEPSVVRGAAAAAPDDVTYWSTDSRFEDDDVVWTRRHDQLDEPQHGHANLGPASPRGDAYHRNDYFDLF